MVDRSSASGQSSRPPKGDRVDVLGLLALPEPVRVGLGEGLGNVQDDAPLALRVDGDARVALFQLPSEHAVADGEGRPGLEVVRWGAE